MKQRHPRRRSWQRPIYLGVDFDGTLVEFAFPEIGREIPMAVQTLQECVSAGALLVLWTRRTGDALDAAVAWCEERGLALHGVNSRPDESGAGPKPGCDVFIDDAALGCPVTIDEDTKARAVDWIAVRRLLWPLLGSEDE